MKIILGILLIVLILCMIVLTTVISAYFVSETSINLKQERMWRDETREK